MGFFALAIAAVFIGLGVTAGRWSMSRAFGIRGFRKRTNTQEDRGHPRIAFARAGASIIGIYLACVFLFIVGFSGGKTVVDDTSMRVTVMTDGPAQRAGIRDGDKVLSVNGEEARDWDRLKRLVGAHPDETISVDVERDGARQTFAVKTVGPKMLVGPFVEKKSLGFGELLGASFAEPFRVARALFGGLYRMIAATEKPELSGPVGISRAVEQAERESPSTFFKMIAAMTSYYGTVASLALLVVAFVMSMMPKGNSVLPTDGNSS